VPGHFVKRLALRVFLALDNLECSSKVIARLSLNSIAGHWRFTTTGHGNQPMSNAKL
jgi:hypothetical protein